MFLECTFYFYFLEFTCAGLYCQKNHNYVLFSELIPVNAKENLGKSAQVKLDKV